MTALSRRLAHASPAALGLYATVAAFCTYFCMYAYRKPFAAASYHGSVEIPGIGALDLKILYITSQVIGYATSKFLGIKVVAEMAPEKRALAILVFIGGAELALLGFGAVPTPWGGLFMALNGLCLGMIWGLVYGFLEGRTTSDMLGAGLCASFILASGVVKSAGTWLMHQGLLERWMPSVTGLLFAPALLLSVLALAQLPRPTAADEAARTKRVPMDGAARWAFFERFAPGLIMLVAGYVALTALRDYRDNYAADLWKALGTADPTRMLWLGEVPAAVVSLLAVAALIVVRQNRRAMMAVHGLLLLGVGVAGLSALAFKSGLAGPEVLMIGGGLGLYLAYVPFNCVLFDRLIAAVGSAANAGFLIYIADSFGYLGSVLLLLQRNFGSSSTPPVDFFVQLGIVGSLLCAVLFAGAAGYFARVTGEGSAGAGLAR